MELFEEKERTDNDPSNHIDNIYDFLDRSSLFDSSQIRETLNEWFQKYPEKEQFELKTRFQSSFSSPFYELFIHELFVKQGFALEPHPIVDGSTKRPDFLVRGEGCEFYLEAKESTDKSNTEKALENRINILYDNLNKTSSPNFFFRINELFLKSERQPSGNEIIKFLEDELKNHEPDNITQIILENGLEGLDAISYEDDDIKLVISLIPKSPEIRGKIGFRPIGIYPISSTWGGADVSIKSSIKKKATRYGVLDKPYLICINSTSDRSADDFDVMNALFGSLQISFSTDPSKRDERCERALDGLFLNSFGPQFTRVSSIMITNVKPWNLHVANHWLVKNPFAKREIDLVNFELSKIVVEDKHIRTIPGKSIKEILGISSDWMTFK